MPETAPQKRGPGRPPMRPEDRVRNRVSTLDIHGVIPEFIGYLDLVSLIRQYRGSMFGAAKFALWVEQGVVPSYFDGDLRTATPGVRRRKYRWTEVRSWLDSRMTRAVPVSDLVPQHPLRKVAR